MWNFTIALQTHKSDMNDDKRIPCIHFCQDLNAFCIKQALRKFSETVKVLYWQTYKSMTPGWHGMTQDESRLLSIIQDDSRITQDYPADYIL